MKQILILLFLLLASIGYSQRLNVPIAGGWSLAGNAATAGSNFIGTTNLTSLRFRTNNVQRMILDSLGNIGIGTLSPSDRLHIVATAGTNPKIKIGDSDLINPFSSIEGISSTVGVIETFNTASGGMLYRGYSMNSSTPGLVFLGLTGSNTPSVSAVEFRAGKLSGTTFAPLGNTEIAYNFKNNDGTQSYMTILGSSNVGIGVSSIGARLHVAGSIRADSMLIVRGTNATGAGIEMINTTASTGVNWSFESRNAGDLQFWRNGTYRGRFAGTGFFWQGAGSFGAANSTVAESLISATDSSASTNAIAVENKLTGDATFIAKTATSGGDPKLLFVNNTTTAGYIGADRTDSLAVIMGLGSAVGTNARMRGSAAGIALGINPAPPTNGAEVRLQGDVIIDRVIANSPKPSCLYVAANGSSGTCTVTYGGDLAFHFEAQSGNTPSLADYLTITFANPLPLNHKPVASITPALLGGVGSVYQLYVDEQNKFNTGFRIKRDGTSSSAFGGDVHVISGY